MLTHPYNVKFKHFILLSCQTGCSLYMIVYVYMYYMRVRLSGCLNHIKGTIIIFLYPG